MGAISRHGRKSLEDRKPIMWAVFQGHSGKPLWEAQVSTHVVGFVHPSLALSILVILGS